MQGIDELDGFRTWDLESFPDTDLGLHLTKAR